MNKTEFGWGGFLLRFVIAFVLVYATYNPEGLSFFHWAVQPITTVPVTTLSAINPLKVLAGLGLFVLWVIYLQATNRALGFKGAVLAAALLGCLIWVLIYWDVFTPRGTRAISHLVLLVLSLVLAIGVSWSHLSRRFTGQVDIDEVGTK